MSWYCKKCETNNDDTDDICVVCNSIPPVLDNVNCEIDAIGTTFRLSWWISNTNKVTILYGDAHFDVSHLHSYDLKIGEGKQVIFEAENDVATRMFTYIELPTKNQSKEQEKQREQEKIAEQKRKDNLAWATACRWNTESSYLAYLRNYPNGIHSGEVKARLDKIKEEDEKWKQAQSLGTIDAYKSYLSRYPTGKYSKQAKELIEEERDKIRQNCFTAGIVALALLCILIPLGIIECESNNLGYTTPPPPAVHHQQRTPEEIDSITKKLDKKIIGLEQAKKEGISRNQTLLDDAEMLLKQLNGTEEYEKYRERLYKVQN